MGFQIKWEGVMKKMASTREIYLTPTNCRGQRHYVLHMFSKNGKNIDSGSFSVACGQTVSTPVSTARYSDMALYSCLDGDSKYSDITQCHAAIDLKMKFPQVHDRRELKNSMLGVDSSKAFNGKVTFEQKLKSIETIGGIVNSCMSTALMMAIIKTKDRRRRLTSAQAVTDMGSIMHQVNQELGTMTMENGVFEVGQEFEIGNTLIQWT